MTIFLKNATYIDWETFKFSEKNIKVNEDPKNPLEFLDLIPDNLSSSDKVLDCTNKLVTKAFGCGHHHVYSALARGMGAPKKNPQNFYENLKYIWWTLDKSLDLEMIKSSALVTAISCAKRGATFVIDHHASPCAVEGSLETIAKAFDEVGVSHLLCYEMSDRDGVESRDSGLAETENYLKSKRDGLVGLHASFTVGDELLSKAVDLAEKYDSGIHVHVAEDHIDQENCLKDYNKRVVERFNDLGVLNFSKTIMSHCLHIDDNERSILRKSGVYIVHNADSNLKNAVGNFNGQNLGKNIMLGTDGMHSDMLRSAKSSFLIGQSIERLDFNFIYERFRKVHKYLSSNKFSGDEDNNLVILNYDSPTEINQDNFLGHFVFGIDSNNIESVISSGKLIVMDKKILTVDENEIYKNSHELGKKLWGKMAQ